MTMLLLKPLAMLSLTLLMVCSNVTLHMGNRYLEEVHPYADHLASGSMQDQFFLHSEESAPPLPSIYWINLESSKQRRMVMENMFAQLLFQQQETNIVRVPAHDERRIQTMLTNGLLNIQNGVTLIAKRYLYGSSFSNHISDKYEYQEAACLVSHLDTIRRAYEAGDEIALILEDDARLTSIFLKHWKQYVDMAPDDWTALQLTTNHPIILKQMAGLSKKDPWISWQPDHWSTRAYLINRKGMEEVLSSTYSFNKERGQPVWNLHSSLPMLNPDEVIFHTTRAYTSTYAPFVDAFEVSSTVQADAAPHKNLASQAIEYPRVPATTSPKRRESILVLTNVRLKEMSGVKDEVEQLRLDALSLCYRHDICDWHVNMVLTKQELKDDPDFVKACSELPSNVHLHVSVSDKGFNKFAFVAQFVDRLKDYDLFLFKDDDQRIMGFPWNSFVEAKGEAVIAGPLRQAVDESLLTNYYQKNRQDFQFHEAMEWKRFNDDAPFNSLFASITPTRTPLLEMYFVLMDGDFASWFFSRILIPEFVDQRNNWGPDLMWCGAAEEFRPGRPGCHLVPLVSKHEDRRQIDKSKEANGASWEDLGHATLSMFRRKDADFARWLSHSEPWQDAIAGWSLPWVQTKCRGFLLTPGNFSLDKCIDRLVAWEEIKLAPMHWIRSLQADAR